MFFPANGLSRLRDVNHMNVFSCKWFISLERRKPFECFFPANGLSRLGDVNRMNVFFHANGLSLSILMRDLNHFMVNVESNVYHFIAAIG